MNAPPTIEQVRKAAAKIQALRGDEIERLQQEQLGDPLLALFAVLAKKMFPTDAESSTVRRVRLMVASYLMRSEIAGGSQPRPPNEARARAAVDAVAGLNGKAFDRRIDAEIGQPLVTFFTGFVGKLMPEQDTDALSGKVHLLLLAYLIGGELEDPPSA